MPADEGAARTTSDQVERRSNREISRGDTPPVDSKIEVVEHSPERLVVHVPPGGASTKGLGWFALIWNLFMCLFTPPWFFAGGAGEGPPVFVLIPFLLAFWSVGLGMAYFWARMRFTRTYLLIEPQRMVLQTQWLRSKSLEEATLYRDSHARLVESYKMNEVPVHRIEITGEEQTLRFGTHLSEPEKEWLRTAINSFLGVDDTQPRGTIPKFCSSCGTSLESLQLDGGAPASGPAACPECGEAIQFVSIEVQRPVLVAASRSPRDVPADSCVRIDEDSPERLAFSLPLLPDGKLRRIASRVSLFVGLIWLGIAGTFLFRALIPLPRQFFDWLGIAFQLPPTLIGGAILWLGLAITRATIRVSIDREWFHIQYRAGFIRKGLRYVTSSIEAIRLRTPADFQSDRKEAASTPIPGTEDSVSATVHCGKSFAPLTTLHSRDIAELVAGLARGRLEEYGVRPSDSPASQAPSGSDHDDSELH
jgi:hypothetical protein